MKNACGRQWHKSYLHAHLPILDFETEKQAKHIAASEAVVYSVIGKHSFAERQKSTPTPFFFNLANLSQWKTFVILRSLSTKPLAKYDVWKLSSLYTINYFLWENNSKTHYNLSLRKVKFYYWPIKE